MITANENICLADLYLDQCIRVHLFLVDARGTLTKGHHLIKGLLPMLACGY